MTRLIPIDIIPTSLWSKENSILHLPPQLILSWEMLLDKNNLRGKANTEAPKGFEGGMSKEDTDNHLAWRFIGSVARVMLAMLDPHQKNTNIANTLTRIFSGNRVFLADLPCGSGAASMSILSVLCELRERGKIPRMPLHIIIIGGKISTYAQEYATEALNSLIDRLESQAIKIEFQVMTWDVCCKFSNTDLIKELILRSESCSAKLLLLANFSGFLERENKWKEAKDQFDELFRYSRDDNSIALWIEPEKNNVTQGNGFFPRILKWFTEQVQKLVGKDKQINNSDYEYSCSSVNVKHPLMEGTFRTNLAIIPLDLPSRDKL
jgi:hypothetical protein